jgi:hypothetical protein
MSSLKNKNGLSKITRKLKEKSLSLILEFFNNILSILEIVNNYLLRSGQISGFYQSKSINGNSTI